MLITLRMHGLVLHVAREIRNPLLSKVHQKGLVRHMVLPTMFRSVAQNQIFLSLYGPRRSETCLRACADSKGPDQPAHPRSLIRAFAVREKNHCILQNAGMGSKELMILCACAG